ncbi:MAG: GspE/PulE family protein [Myxococcota bacterium]|nr:GspE/PulE family protein [Myxococcota bacterium]
MTASIRTKFDLLIEQGLINEADLLQAAAEAQELQLDVEQVLMRRFRVPKAHIGAALAHYYGCPYVPFDPRLPPPRAVLRSLKPGYLRTDRWVPIKAHDHGVTVLIDDPNHLIKRDEVRALLPGMQIEYCVGLREDIEAFIDHFYGHLYGTAASPPAATPATEPVPEEPSVEVVIEEVREPPPDEDQVVALVAGLLGEACERGATDIHIEPSAEQGPVQVRLRLDGRLRPFRTLPAEYHPPMLSCIKSLSSLEPQDETLPRQGMLRIRREGGSDIVLRVATVPLHGGLQDVVLHVLPGGQPPTLEQLRFSERNLVGLQQLLERPWGLLLVAGPPRSGRTTTLHAALNHLNRPDRMIGTVEDPVERVQPGLRQVSLQPGLDVPAAVRGLLRADPDVIMIGELRDRQACGAALEAALSGHLVLAGLRAHGAAEALQVLLELGGDPDHLGTALLGVLAQRLVRKLCEACLQPYELQQAEWRALAAEYGEPGLAELGVAPDAPLYRPVGCEICQGSGFQGRLALHELLQGSPALRRLLRGRAPVNELHAQACQDGMRTLRQDGIAKALEGLTDLGEVRAACPL